MLKSSSDITPEILKEIENFGALFFVPAEIAIMLEIDAEIMEEGVKDPQNKIHNAFYKGRLQSEIELRQSIIKLAKSGSSPAQTMSLDLLNKSKIKLL